MSESSSLDARRAPKQLLRGLCVLVVEDDADTREAVAQVLEHAGARVVEASSGPEGFDTFRRERPDVVVADLWMPGGDGYEMIRRIRQLPDAAGGRTPAVATTAVRDAKDALVAGYNSLLEKPLELEGLLDELYALTRHD